ncbi:MAG TPA: exodeoxyribonuclease VII small subunit [Candidatus Acidoferrales bacterium]|nr:exodeoxyribonuclease VII small subunit [Candidatus Acidoferrales bacterium]
MSTGNPSDVYPEGLILSLNPVKQPMENDGSAKTFNESMAALERIVDELESGELPLEAALAAFEAGVALVRDLNQRLTDAEQRVEVLTRDADGTLQSQPMERNRRNKE